LILAILSALLTRCFGSIAPSSADQGGNLSFRFDPMRRTARREHLMSVIREPWNQARADKAGTADDENLHGHTHFDLDLQMAFIA
jgi:hypothetical protein